MCKKFIWVNIKRQPNHVLAIYLVTNSYNNWKLALKISAGVVGGLSSAQTREREPPSAPAEIWLVGFDNFFDQF